MTIVPPPVPQNRILAHLNERVTTLEGSVRALSGYGPIVVGVVFLQFVEALVLFALWLKAG